MNGFFESVRNFFSSVWETITSIFNAIGAVLSFLWSLFDFVVDVFGALPVTIFVCLTVALVIYIIYKIVGR